jgi:hypothetical protein
VWILGGRFLGEKGKLCSIHVNRGAEGSIAAVGTPASCSNISFVAGYRGARITWYAFWLLKRVTGVVLSHYFQSVFIIILSRVLVNIDAGLDRLIDLLDIH